MDSNRAVADDVESIVPAPAQGTELPPIDKIRKHGAEEFRAIDDDDAERAEFWLDNTIQVFDKLSCTPDECLKCAISLLRDTAYHWWNTLVSVVPKEQVSWEFFQSEFRNKYISQRFIDQKCKEFLELKQGRITVTEYERKFIKEFVVLVERACKAEELGKEKRKANFEARDFRKRSFSKSFQSTSKKFKDDTSRSKATAGYSRWDRDRPPMSSRATSVASVGNVRSNQPECEHCGKRHPDSCRLLDRACFKWKLKDNYICECPELANQNLVQNTRSGNTATRGKPPRNTSNMSGSQSGTKDTAVRFEARAPAKAYAIRSREEASSLDFITGTFTLHDTNLLH
ncbi:uncharacterized protein LOC105801112 [Gossypium raimondii]|uniref:uncharacterized protein LOC105801112 n=1 Tax=Gossypium raimondii TaxID=29730 RepID=UPI00063A8FC2|nr:uncharacterized protein LOC105801112 [Gossypium raimondii]